MCVCVRACVRAYVRAYVRACVRVCVCVEVGITLTSPIVAVGGHLWTVALSGYHEDGRRRTQHIGLRSLPERARIRLVETASITSAVDCT